jgi:uncharacterized protein
MDFVDGMDVVDGIRPSSISNRAYKREKACFSQSLPIIRPNAERRTPNAERRTPNAESRTPNAERRTPNAERRTPNAERRTPNAERRTPNAERPPLTLVPSR